VLFTNACFLDICCPNVLKNLREIFATFSKKAVNKQWKEKGSHREKETRGKMLAFHLSPLSHAYFFTEAIALNVPKKTTPAPPKKSENKHEQVPK